MRVRIHSGSEREKIQAEIQTLGKQLGKNTKKEKKKAPRFKNDNLSEKMAKLCGTSRPNIGHEKWEGDWSG